MLRISQSRLARISAVSRFQNLYVRGGSGSLSVEEQCRIRGCLGPEKTDRLRTVQIDIDFDRRQSLPVQKEPLIRHEKRASSISTQQAVATLPYRALGAPVGIQLENRAEIVRDEFGPGILRHEHAGRRSKRDYTTITVAASAAARVYSKHTKSEMVH